MAIFIKDSRRHAECNQCGFEATGDEWEVERWGDEHEAENPGHSVDIQESFCG